jgi:GTP-binding protein HflX
LLIGVALGRERRDDSSLDELCALAESAGHTVSARLICHRPRPDPKLYIGTGKADEIAALLAADGTQLVLFDHEISAVQQRNLERLWKVRVLDRTELILDIFGQRARSTEGKLQVELAQLQHQSSRLVRAWSHLERQRGGIGKSRDRNSAFKVSLVGYTNAGKSTLFNALTGAGTYAADQLFATLDTLSRKLVLGPDCEIVLSDTVGFVRDLPHQLVEAFRATLDETAQADLLLHVVDAAAPDRAEQIEQVQRVLADIGADRVPQWLVWNKIDSAGLEPDVELNGCGTIHRLFLSARTGAGLPLLRRALSASSGSRGLEAGVPFPDVSINPNGLPDVDPNSRIVVAQ